MSPTTSAGPTATPGLPAMPLSTTPAACSRRWAADASLRAAAAGRGSARSSTLPELVGDELADRLDALLGALALARAPRSRSPCDPQSRSTPITLLPFALWSSRASSTSHGYFDASCTSFVAARAWRPSWLTILKRALDSLMASPRSSTALRPSGREPRAARRGGGGAVTPLSSRTLDRSSSRLAAAARRARPGPRRWPRRRRDGATAIGAPVDAESCLRQRFGDRRPSGAARRCSRSRW